MNLNGSRLIEGIASDCGYAFRTLSRRPKFAAIAVLTITVGIAAASSMFTIVDHVLVRPLKYKDADRLVTVWATVSAMKTDTIAGEFWNRFTVYEDYDNWRRQQNSFEETTVFATNTLRFVGTDQTRFIHTARSAANFFPMLGVRFFLGRGYSTEDMTAVVVSHEFWNSDLGGDRDRNVIGRTILVGDGPKTVVGVLPPHFDLAGYGTNSGPAADVWLPLRVTIHRAPTTRSSVVSGPEYRSPLHRAKPTASSARCVLHFSTNSSPSTNGRARISTKASGRNGVGEDADNHHVPRVGLAAAHRVRQRRQFTSRRGGSTRTRDRGAIGSRRDPLARHAGSVCNNRRALEILVRRQSTRCSDLCRRCLRSVGIPRCLRFTSRPEQRLESIRLSV